MEISVIPTNFEPPQDKFPFPSPFILSSAERDWCRFRPNKEAAIVFIKRRHLEENIKALSGTGMDEAERNRFLDYWCSPSTRNPEEIRAEKDDCFNLRQRVTSWMERARPNMRSPRSSKLEQNKEEYEKFQQLLQYGFVNQQAPADSTPDDQLWQ